MKKIYCAKIFYYNLSFATNEVIKTTLAKIDKFNTIESSGEYFKYKHIAEIICSEDVVALSFENTNKISLIIAEYTLSEDDLYALFFSKRLELKPDNYWIYLFNADKKQFISVPRAFI